MKVRLIDSTEQKSKGAIVCMTHGLCIATVKDGEEDEARMLARNHSRSTVGLECDLVTVDFADNKSINGVRLDLLVRRNN